MANQNVAVNETSLTAIANALKAKAREDATFTPLQFANAVLGITSTTPSGTVNISTLNLTDVTGYASAKISDSNLVTGNIKNGISILGVTGKSTVMDAIGGEANAEEIFNTKTAFVNGQQITGTGRIYVSGTIAYIPEDWIELYYNGKSIFDESQDVIFAGSNFFAGEEIGLL